MTVFQQSLLYSGIPAILTATAGSYALLRKPGEQLTCMVQHFAAGLIFAVVAVELLPDIIHQRVFGVMLSFALGVCFMLSVRKLTARMGSQRGLSVLLPVGIDLLLDGLLIGIGFAANGGQGKMLGIALGIEGLSLGLALGVELQEGRSLRHAFVLLLLLAALYVAGGGAGSTILASMPKSILADALSFASAALLYLVTEELLMEAHKTKETTLSTVMFFAGFAAVELLEMLQLR